MRLSKAAKLNGLAIQPATIPATWRGEVSVQAAAVVFALVINRGLNESISASEYSMIPIHSPLVSMTTAIRELNGFMWTRIYQTRRKGHRRAGLGQVFKQFSYALFSQPIDFVAVLTHDSCLEGPKRGTQLQPLPQYR